MKTVLPVIADVGPDVETRKRLLQGTGAQVRSIRLDGAAPALSRAGKGTAKTPAMTLVQATSR